MIRFEVETAGEDGLQPRCADLHERIEVLADRAIDAGLEHQGPGDVGPLARGSSDQRRWEHDKACEVDAVEVVERHSRNGRARAIVGIEVLLEGFDLVRRDRRNDGEDAVGHHSLCEETRA